MDDDRTIVLTISEEQLATLISAYRNHCEFDDNASMVDSFFEVLEDKVQYDTEDGVEEGTTVSFKLSIDGEHTTHEIVCEE